MRCRWCDEVLVRSGARGPSAVFCSTRCRTARHRASQRLPAELMWAPRWIRHDNKRPITVSGAPASSTDSSTWTTFDRADASTAGTGLGFVLNGDGIVCIDIDHCLDGNQLPLPWVRSLLARMPDTWIEVSPSGDGLHVWGVGDVDPGRVKRYRGHKVEVYGDLRFITVTRNPFRSAATKLGDLPALTG